MTIVKMWHVHCTTRDFHIIMISHLLFAHCYSVTVPSRNHWLFHCVIRSHHCIQSTILLNSRTHTHFVDAWISMNRIWTPPNWIREYGALNAAIWSKYATRIIFSSYIQHMTVMYMSVICLSHIQQEVENALEGLCKLLPSSIASTVGALESSWPSFYYHFQCIPFTCLLTSSPFHAHTHTHTQCDSFVQSYFPVIWQLIQSEFVSKMLYTCTLILIQENGSRLSVPPPFLFACWDFGVVYEHLKFIHTREISGFFGAHWGF